jgi:hypothetical protein
MSLLVWAMMGIAWWHFAVFVPDRFRGGIVGAFAAAVIGAIVIGLAINGMTIPARSATHLIQAVIALPGALLGLAICWGWGAWHERRHAPSS